MKPGIRTPLSLIPIALQFLAMCSGIGAISFMADAINQFVWEHSQNGPLPAPSRLVLGHPHIVEAMVIFLFAVSVAGYLLTGWKVKDDADRATIRSAVYGVTWYVGVTFVGGVLMAEVLPYVAFYGH